MIKLNNKSVKDYKTLSSMYKTCIVIDTEHVYDSYSEDAIASDADDAIRIAQACDFLKDNHFTIEDDEIFIGTNKPEDGNKFLDILA